MKTVYPVIISVGRLTADLPANERKTRLSKYARSALIVSARKSGLKLPPRLLKRTDGSPIPQGGVWWSISHKPSYVGGIAAQQMIGLDIEKVGPRSDPLFDKVVSPSEERLFNHPRWTIFFRCWTAKEATLKSCGLGIGRLPDCKIEVVVDDSLLFTSLGGKKRFVVHRFFNDHIAALAMEEKQPVKWSLLEKIPLNITTAVHD